MPRYFFNVYDGYSDLDDTGTDLPDIHDAKTEAVRLSGEILRDTSATFWNGTRWRLEVTDQQGKVLFVLHFTAEEAPLGPSPPGGR